MSLGKIHLAPNYPDLWRRDFFYPACKSGGNIAIIGVGSFHNYLKYDWVSVGYKGFDALYCHHNTVGKYYIFDVSKEAVGSLKKIGLNAEQIDICEKALPGTYDYIFAADVIEHTESPGQMLRNICNSLTRGGIAVLTTPNADHWRNAIPFRLGEEPSHWFSFSKRNFENLAKHLGLEIVCLKDFRTASPFRKNYSRLKEAWHKLMGGLLSHNSLLFCFKKSK